MSIWLERPSMSRTSREQPEEADEVVETTGVAEFSSAVLERIKENLVASYVLLRNAMCGAYPASAARVWDQSEDAFGRRRRRSAWTQLAEHVLSVQADPYEYLYAQFVAQRTPPPSPVQMRNRIAVDNWRRLQADAGRRLAEQLRAEQMKLAAAVTSLTVNLQWDVLRAMRYALMNPQQFSLSAVFRHCQAAAENLVEAAATTEAAAVVQYLAQEQAFDAAWQGFVPDTLRQRAAAIRQQLGLTRL